MRIDVSSTVLSLVRIPLSLLRDAANPRGHR